MAKQVKSERKLHEKRISRGKKGHPLRKRQEIKRQQIRKRKLVRKMKYITTFTALIIIVSLVILFHLSSLDEDNVSNNSHPNMNDSDIIGKEVGQTAPNFELEDIDGNKITLMDYRGSVIILDFMADRCAPCHDEIDHLKEVHTNYSNKGVRIISMGVDNSESSEQLKNNVKEAHGCDWIFAAGCNQIGDTYGVEYIPMIYIIDKQGIIAYKNVGLTDYSTLSYELDIIA